MDGLRGDLGQLLNDWLEKRRVATRDAHVRLMYGTAALVVVAILVCCLLVYTLFIERPHYSSSDARLRKFIPIPQRSTGRPRTTR
ncbi:hypothetical protein ACQKRQ_09485 [Paraburkholderia sp. NPDC080076]|uniref:hypothetical protein n=1 Tax=Paraburkholderia sp. NPDC080076 TaxID=3390605 RepID=UPI003D08D849